eukprot:1133679-Pelagomonas_calceolata.AAC.1
MATAPDPDTREHWRWSTYGQVATQGPFLGFGDHVVQTWLEQTHNLTPLKIGEVPGTLGKKTPCPQHCSG